MAQTNALRNRPTLSDRTLDEVLAAAALSYTRLPRALRQAHPDAVARALELADGNPRRLVVDDDGGVLVLNRPAW